MSWTFCSPRPCLPGVASYCDPIDDFVRVVVTVGYRVLGMLVVTSRE